MTQPHPGGRCVLAGEELDEVYRLLRQIDRTSNHVTVDLTDGIRTILSRANDATQVKT